jgi:hypothetical protein
MMDLNGKDVSQDFLAQVRYQLKVSFFLYKRKKARWVSLFETVDKLIKKPIDFDQVKLRTDQDKKKVLSEDKPITLDDMILKPTDNDAKKITKFRVLSVMSMLFCALIIVTEATVIVHPTYTLFHWVSSAKVLTMSDHSEASILCDSQHRFYLRFLGGNHSCVLLHNIQSQIERLLVTCTTSY